MVPKMVDAAGDILRAPYDSGLPDLDQDPVRLLPNDYRPDLKGTRRWRWRLRWLFLRIWWRDLWGRRA
jgi:hypothetical protein